MLKTLEIKLVQVIVAAILLFVSFAGANVSAAGFQRVRIHDGLDGPIPVAIWYPSPGTPTIIDIGSIRQAVAVDGEVAGNALPLVVISHGVAGSALSHHDTAVALADAGFVVAAPTHPGDNHADQSKVLSILDRPRHVQATLDYMLERWPQRDRLDIRRIGIFGFSAGGFTALASIGGEADFSRIAPHCERHPGHFTCVLRANAKDRLSSDSAPSRINFKDARIGAAVVAAPALGFTFDSDGLGAVTAPVQLWRAENDAVLPDPWYAEAVRKALPAPPEYHVVADAGHFDFLAPCDERTVTEAPRLCTSARGFDRAAFHRDFNRKIIDFFRKSLP